MLPDEGRYVGHDASQRGVVFNCLVLLHTLISLINMEVGINVEDGINVEGVQKWKITKCGG